MAIAKEEAEEAEKTPKAAGASVEYQIPAPSGMVAGADGERRMRIDMGNDSSEEKNQQTSSDTGPSADLLSGSQMLHESGGIQSALPETLNSLVSRGDRDRQLGRSLGPDGEAAPAEALNERALAVISRVEAKLLGRDFTNGAEDVDAPNALDVPAQVDRLVKQATAHENLCQCYIGWCPFW